MTDVLITDKQIMKLAGKKTHLVTYPELKDYKTLDDLFGNNDKVIILYINTIDSNSISGHWCALIRHHKGKKIIVEFADPYGKPVDESLKWHTKSKNRELGQSKNYLSKLLYDFSLNPNNEVHYNENKLQRMAENINTCGRHIGLRCHFNKIPLEQWQEIWDNLKNRGYNLDKIAVALTDLLL